MNTPLPFRPGVAAEVFRRVWPPPLALPGFAVVMFDAPVSSRTLRPLRRGLLHAFPVLSAPLGARRAAPPLLAPARAKTLANPAQGTAADMLSTIAVAFQGPLLIAPAMNPSMSAKAATQEALEILVGQFDRPIAPSGGIPVGG